MLNIETSSTLCEIAFNKAALKTLEILSETAREIADINGISFDPDVFDEEMQGAGCYMECSIFDEILEDEQNKLAMEFDKALAIRMSLA
jgi:hypothetical protein